MKTPINGARRKHPILGYTKMHTGKTLLHQQATIMASGDGKVRRVRWREN